MCQTLVEIFSAYSYYCMHNNGTSMKVDRCRYRTYVHGGNATHGQQTSNRQTLASTCGVPRFFALGSSDAADATVDLGRPYVTSIHHHSMTGWLHAAGWGGGLVPRARACEKHVRTRGRGEIGWRWSRARCAHMRT
jgi:hypothetical protein